MERMSEAEGERQKERESRGTRRHFRYVCMLRTVHLQVLPAVCALAVVIRELTVVVLVLHTQRVLGVGKRKANPATVCESAIMHGEKTVHARPRHVLVACKKQQRLRR